VGDANLDPVRVAVMSPGGWGRRYLEAVRGSPRLKLEGVCSRQAETAAAAGAEFGGRAFRRYDELVRDPAVEAVLLPTPHFLHYAQAKAALLAGKHVFVEKPLANTIAEAEELAALSQARGLILAVGLQGRRTAGIRRARAMLDSGELGRVGLVTVTHGSPQVHQNYRSGDWETSDATMPGGILDQLGVHYADVLQYLLGPVVRVAGFVNRHVSAFPTIDCGAATYEFASGVVALHATHQVSAYISEVRLFTDRGLLQISRMGRELTWEPIAELAAAKAGATTRHTLPLSGAEMNTTAIAEELDEFAGCIRTGARPEVGAAEGLRALRLMRAVMEAHATGRAVSLAQP
jgi:predicted dehydrogenase